uniref:BTB domain-containing protein n=1 Tax=Panagrolaimus sp. ES5 TaxID=591445 RepID=A0AC34FTG2_9BILA
MFQEFEFYETLPLYNSFGKKIVDCSEGRSYTVTYKKLEDKIYEISITDCIPENLKVEVLPKKSKAVVSRTIIESVAPNKYKYTVDQDFTDNVVLLKSTKFFKKIEPIIKNVEKVSCIYFDATVLKKLKLGEITKCQYKPFEGVVIDCSVQHVEVLQYRRVYNINKITLKCKTHDLEYEKKSNAMANYFSSDYINLEFLPGTKAPYPTNGDESVVSLMKNEYGNGPAVTLKIYEKQMSIEEKINAFGPTDVCIKSFDGKIIKVHKNILSSKSGIFKALFGAKAEMMPIEIDSNHNADIIYRAMAYIYENSFEIGDKEIEVYKFADEYGIEKLKEKCVELLEKASTDNISKFKIYKFAMDHNVPYLQAKFSNFLNLPNRQFSQMNDKEALKNFENAKNVAAAAVL